MELLGSFFGIDAFDNETAGRKRVLLGGGDEALYEWAELLGLRDSSGDPLLQHQRASEGSQKSDTLTALSAECSIAVVVTHRIKLISDY